MDLDRPVLAQAAAGGDLDIGGHADAEQLAVTAGATLGLLAPQFVVPGETGGLLERQEVVSAVVHGPRDRVEREHVVGEQVPAPDLDGVDAKLERRVVDRPLEQCGCLGATGTAVGTGGDGVRGSNRYVELDLREAIGAVRHPLRACRQVAADRGVRTTVADEVDAHAGERAVRAAPELHILDLRSAVAEHEHVLAPGGGPGDRTLQAERKSGDNGLLGVRTDLATETAAHVRGDDVYLRLGVPDGGSEEVVEHVRHLRGGVDAQSTVGLDVGGGGEGLEGGYCDALVDVAATDDDIGIVQDVWGVGVGHGHRNVVAVDGEQHGRAGCHRLLGVNHARQLVVVDDDHGSGVACLSGAVGGNNGDCLAHKADHVHGERGAREVVVDLRHAVLRVEVEVRRGVHANDSGGRRSVGHVDRDDPCVRVLGAHECEVHWVDEWEVTDVGRPAEEQLGVFRAGYLCSEN
ncbi:unannotated protein [freshwater metagenome]|uniref:Unannotated protein n=1 Tax=freshwater metagenome TaxID=449393 RepID=A0A6J7EKB6_9ZZZZ